MARILVVASYTPSLVNFRGPMLQMFRDLGHEVLTCSPDPDSDTLAKLTAMGIRHIPFPLHRAGMNPLRDLHTLSALRGIMRRELPDHVLAYTIKPVVYGCRAAHQAGVPHIHALITGLGMSFQGQDPRRKILTALVSHLYRSALRFCKNVFFQNRDDRTLFESRGLVDPKRVTLVNGSGIDLDHFAHAPLPTRPPLRFLLIARLIREKGIAVYAEAARMVKAQFPDATFSVVGFFDEHPEAIRQEEMTAWCEEGILEYLGPSGDVRSQLADATVYCLPTYYREGVPRSILEALAVGRPVITTDAPGCRDTVIPGENGFLVPVRDSEALAQSMKELCREPERIPAMGLRSRDIAEERYDVHKVNECIKDAMGLPDHRDSAPSRSATSREN